MNMMGNLKTMTKDQVMRAMIELTAHVSPETFLKLITLAAKIPESPVMRARVEKVRDHLMKGEDDPATRLFHRVLTELSPRCLKTFSRTLFLRGLLDAANVRDAFHAEHGFMPPFTLLISPTMRCNLRCTGCYSGKYVQEKGLPYELLDRVIGEARDMGTRFIVFSGGEPLTRKADLFRLAKVYQKDMYFMLYTNSTLIDDETADEIADLGNIGAIISLEGFEEATDARRGPGVYQHVMDAMDRLKTRGVPFGTSLTVTSGNVKDITDDAFIGHLYEKGIMVAWYFLFMPVGKDPDTSLMPSPEQREYLRVRGLELRKKFPVFIADFWNDAPHVGGCIAGGRNYFHINAQGDVEPCVFCHTTVDSIYDNSVTEVLTSEFFQKIRSYQPHSENMLAPCMIIDNPHIYREVVQSAGARPTHDGADDLLTTLPDWLDGYSDQVHQYLDPIWQQEKGSYGYTNETQPADQGNGNGSPAESVDSFQAVPLSPDNGNGNGTGRQPLKERTSRVLVNTASVDT